MALLYLQEAEDLDVLRLGISLMIQTLDQYYLSVSFMC